jgi:hypothetical protein
MRRSRGHGRFPSTSRRFHSALLCERCELLAEMRRTRAESGNLGNGGLKNGEHRAMRAVPGNMIMIMICKRPARVR